jgi:hypothetical protein
MAACHDWICRRREIGKGSPDASGNGKWRVEKKEDEKRPERKLKRFNSSRANPVPS